MELISIISPSYNSEKFIHDTIKSVLAQTYSFWELIIVDDNSTDNSIKIIEQYAKTDARIKLLINPTNKGAAFSRNKALEHSRGRFIAFLDSDDIWEPEKLKFQIDFMIKHDCSISFTEYACFNEDLSKKLYIIHVPESIDYRGYLKNTIIGMSTSMIDKAKVGKFGFFDLRTRQDTYLWITLLKNGHIAHGIQKCLAKYRARKTSISSNKIKAARQVWFLYHNLEQMNFFRAVYYFAFYVYNTLKKRILN